MSNMLFVLGLFLILLAFAVLIGTNVHFKQVGWTKREENFFYLGFSIAIFFIICIGLGILLFYLR